MRNLNKFYGNKNRQSDQNKNKVVDGDADFPFNQQYYNILGDFINKITNMNPHTITSFIKNILITVFVMVMGKIINYDERNSYLIF